MKETMGIVRRAMKGIFLTLEALCLFYLAKVGVPALVSVVPSEDLALWVLIGIGAIELFLHLPLWLMQQRKWPGWVIAALSIPIFLLLAVGLSSIAIFGGMNIA